MLNNCEMSSVCVDTGVMWRLSEDFNRRFVARVHQSHIHHHHHHHQHFRPSAMSMFYNGIGYCSRKIKFILRKIGMSSNYTAH